MQFLFPAQSDCRFFLMEAMRLCITTSLGPLALAAFLMCGSVLPLTAPVFAADHVPLAASARPQKLEATPAWVTKVAPEWDARDATAPVYLPLLDVQTRVDARQTYRYSHVIRKIRDTAGLESGSQILMIFDPNYQKLSIHQLQIVRNGKVIQKFDPKKIRYLQRESRLEAQMLDGQITASITLDDARAGDQIEYAYTLTGANPVFDGRFVDIEWVYSNYGPVSQFYYRLQHPDNRQMQWKYDSKLFEMQQETRGGWKETVLRRRFVPAFQNDPYGIAPTYLKDQIQISEFRDWNDVAQWSKRLFQSAYQPAPDIEKEAERLAKLADTPELALLKTLDFVQKEVRYFGTEIGENSHLPHPPADVLRQRFGDCKDKTGLLIALLKAQKIDAEPVLVSTAFRDDTPQLLPSPLAFNHVIARVKLNGKTYWLDGTRSFQTGDLKSRQALAQRTGLPAQADTRELVAMPDSSRDLQAVTWDQYTIQSMGKPAVLDVRQTYYGDGAESLRASLAANRKTDIEKEIIAEYLRFYPAAQVDGSLGVTEENGQNALTLTLRFSLPEFWRYHEKQVLQSEFSPVSLLQTLRMPTQVPRTETMRISPTGMYRHVTDIRFSEPVFSKTFNKRFDETNKHFEIHSIANGEVDHVQIQSDLRFMRDRVEPADWTTYRDKVQRGWNGLLNTLTVNAISTPQLVRAKLDMADLEKAIKEKKISVYSEAQVEAVYRLPVLDAQLNSGRLSEKQKADVYQERAQRLQQIGRLKGAKSDIEKALQIKPQELPLLLQLGQIAQMQNNLPEAARIAKQMLELQANDVSAQSLLASTLYQQKQYAASAAQWRVVLADRNEAEKSTAVIGLFLAAQAAGQDPVAATSEFLPQSTQPAWPYPVLQVLHGQLSESALQEQLKNGGKPDYTKVTEASYALGQFELQKGNKAQAKAWFQKAMFGMQMEMPELYFSDRQIEALK